MSPTVDISSATASPAPQAGALFPTRGSRFFNADFILHSAALLASIIVIAMMITLIVVLMDGAMPSIKHFGLRFLTTADWRSAPSAVKNAQGHYVKVPGDTYGALAVIYGTAMTSLIALLLAVPPSIAASIFLIRIAPRWLAAPASFLIEFLAAIPSLAYGLWGLLVLAPFMQQYAEPWLIHLVLNIPGLAWLGEATDGTPITPTGNDLFVGGLILAIMILPIITAVARDVLRSVPRAQIEGTVALGATWWQSSKEMLKYSRSGLFGAVTLGLARAAGETMAITMVIGVTTQIPRSPFDAAQTMSSLLAISFGEVSSLEKSALIEIALILLVMSLIFNIVARQLVVGKDTHSARAA